VFEGGREETKRKEKRINERKERKLNETQEMNGDENEKNKKA
jgi:hypothetical protein